MEILRVTQDQKTTLANILELYLYDLNDIISNSFLFELNSNGRFHFPDLELFLQAQDRFAYIFWSQNKPIGCALIHQNPFFKKSNPVHVIAEFFVLKMYRRKGVGLAACSAIMNKYPGPWEIRVVQQHINGMLFWTKVLKAVAPNQHEIINKFDHEWKGFVLCANINSNPTPSYLNKHVID